MSPLRGFARSNILFLPICRPYGTVKPPIANRNNIDIIKKIKFKFPSSVGTIKPHIANKNNIDRTKNIKIIFQNSKLRRSDILVAPKGRNNRDRIEPRRGDILVLTKNKKGLAMRSLLNLFSFSRIWWGFLWCVFFHRCLATAVRARNVCQRHTIQFFLHQH